MIFGKKKDDTESAAGVPSTAEALEMILVADSRVDGNALRNACADIYRTGNVRCLTPDKVTAAECRNARHIVSVFQPSEIYGKLQEIVIQLRTPSTTAAAPGQSGNPTKFSSTGFPTLIVVVQPQELRLLGSWLGKQAETERLQGLRLLVANTPGEILPQLPSRLTAVPEPNIIRMPATTEVECKQFKNFFAISDELRYIVKLMKELAENNISRVYLLGAPGAGKTTLAYFYHLCRAKGNFVAVNLTAESTGDKESMKSLLCGHVPGALPGAASREGAFSFAADGTCFLDESHGVTGVVMQVMMEVLDSGQFLPYGATKKRSLDCAVIFASNRSWEALREMMNMDEHARLGATIIKLSDLAAREEDLIAVLAMTLETFAKKCTTWKPPTGVTPAAWADYKKCQWRGNTRTLIRVTETACVSFATAGSPGGLIDSRYVREGIDLWEPETHSTAGMYVSFRPGQKSNGVSETASETESTSRFVTQS